MATSQDLLKQWSMIQTLYSDRDDQYRAMTRWAEKNNVTPQMMSDTFGGSTAHWEGIASQYGSAPATETVSTQGGTNPSTGSNYTLDQVKQLWTSNSGTKSISDSAAQTYLDQLNSGALSESQLTQRARNHGIANGFIQTEQTQEPQQTGGDSTFQQGATDQGMLTGSTDAPTAATGLMGILEQGAGAYGGADNWFRAMYDEAVNSGMSTEQALAIAQEYNPNVTAEDMFGYFADNNLVDPTAYLFQDGGVNADQGQRYVDYVNSLDLTDEQKQQLLSSAAETSNTDTAAYTDPTTGMLGAYGSYMNQVNGYNPVNAQALARNTIRAGEESLSDYYGRLAMERPGGILGQGLMTSAATPGSEAWTSQVVSDMFPELAGQDVGGNTVGGYDPNNSGEGVPNQAIDWNDAPSWAQDLIMQAIPGMSMVDAVTAATEYFGGGGLEPGYSYSDPWDNPIFSSGGSSSGGSSSGGSSGAPASAPDTSGMGTTFI